VKFIKESIGNLQEKYKEIYLLRNEERYKIYDFDKGRGFMPDFILFLKDKNTTYYQVFIEPKGIQLLQYDSWKEKFLDDISTKYGLKNILHYENKSYKLIGLPFFNDGYKQEFQNKYKTIINNNTTN
jgi:type III restriction enzyme